MNPNEFLEYILRWEDDLNDFFKDAGVEWFIAAQNQEDWKSYEDKFINHVCKDI